MRELRGAIIMPSSYRARHLHGWGMITRIVFNRISLLCGFPLIYAHSSKPYPSILEDLDVVLVFGIPYHNRPGIPLGLLESKVKIISYYGDLPCYGNKACEENKKLMFERSDLIIGGFHERFLEWYPEFVHKYEFFPGCYFPYERYEELEINLDPLMKCILIGARNAPYPFRQYIRSQHRQYVGEMNQILTVKDRHAVPYRMYPAFVNRYFGGIATSGIDNCIVAKYYEIPATGALLLGEREKELDMLGFEPGVHYVPITREDVFDKIRYVLSHPEDYLEMRKKARSFVREHHSDINRAQQFKTMVERLMK